MLTLIESESTLDRILATIKTTDSIVQDAEAISETVEILVEMMSCVYD
jgi:hypothetical protein